MSTTRNDSSTIKSDIGGENPGTVRASGDDIDSGYTAPGTAHAGPDITSGMHGAVHNTSGMNLNPGDPLVIKSVTYCYEGIISKSTAEAEIYLLSNDGRKCVFKLYYPNFKPKDDILKSLMQLNHEDIINVLDYGYHQDRFFEIMDYAEGGTLVKYLPIRDAGRIRQIVKEAVNAYYYCHNHGIVHKDIKPQNLYFKNTDGTDLLIGDFGISTLLETGMSRHLTNQSLTVGYAAPEMYGLGGKVYVGKEVDYYALGITLIHLWDGKSPFDGLGIHAISNMTTSGKVYIPHDMPQDLQKLVRGLITVDYTKRWGHDEVSRWLRGEDVPVHFQVKEINYPPYQFSAGEAAMTAEELAPFLKKSPDKGKKQLYSNKISAWVNLFNQGLSSELDMIIEDDYPKDQDAGLQKAIYILNPDEPFIAANGKECRSSEELGDTLEGNLDRKSTRLNSSHNSESRMPSSA
jgi:serine/threonine protein kinase